MLTTIHVHYLSKDDITDKILECGAKLENGVVKRSFVQLLERKERLITVNLCCKYGNFFAYVVYPG